MQAAKEVLLLSQSEKEIESLFQENYQRIYRAAYRITGSDVDAEDILQTVFLKIIRNEQHQRLSPNPTGYLLRAAINGALDLVRKRGRSRDISLEDAEPELIENPAHSPQSQQEDRELRREVNQAVAQLGDKSGEIFVLRYFEGYDNHEIAQMLGTSQILVAVLLHRARNRVRKQLAKFLEDRNETR